MMNAAKQSTSEQICNLDDLVAYSGVCALWQDQQIALFYLPDQEPSIYAIANWDPIGQAEVLSRGLVGDIDGVPVVASPLYKQHFDLRTGNCLEDPQVSVPTFQVSLDQTGVWLHPQAGE